MEKLLQPYDKEYMKMAMLKHEETFKEQVYELHRLYRIQKVLMKNIGGSGSNGWNQKRWNSENGISLNQAHHHHDVHQKKPQKNLDLERPAEDYIAESDGDGVVELEDELEIELTLGPTSYNRRKKAETPLTSDSGPSFSSSSTGSSHIKKTNSDRTREELTPREWGLVQVPDANPGFQSGRKNNLDVEEQLRQERLKQPPWLFQVLSLNMA